MTKMYLRSFVTFTRNEVRGTHLVFSEEETYRCIKTDLSVSNGTKCPNL